MTTTDPLVRLAVADGIARLELNRPGAANAINLELAIALEAAAQELRDDRSVRAVLLTGAGARFCGGGDVASFAGATDTLGQLLAEIPVHVHEAIRILTDLDAPVVAAVQGSAAGAGLGLVLASDLVIAASSCKFVMAFTGIGLSPDGSSTWFLPRVVGYRRAVELALRNRVLTAAEALDWGIVNSVVGDGALSSEADALVTALASGPTLAFGRAKRLMRDGWGAGLVDHMEEERRQLAASGNTADGREGVSAFVEKRRPNFGGH